MSPLCFHFWYFNKDILENTDPQTSQENNFSPVFVRLWILQDDWHENATQQSSQKNVFSPVCFCM